MTDRFLRQKTLDFIGESGQARLSRAHAVLIGLGAIGCTTADLLARAGLASLTLIDGDTVDLTNLHRQSLFTQADAQQALPKVQAATNRLLAIDPALRITPIAQRVSPENADQLVPPCDLILDGTDNYDARYLLNDLAVKRGVPLCYAGAVGASGMAMTILPHRSACLRCVFPDPPETHETCESAGVFPPAVYLAASTASSDALRLLAGHSGAIGNVLTRFDTRTGHIAQTRVERDASCPCCGEGKFEFLEKREQGVRVEAVCGKGAVRVMPGAASGAALDRIAARCREKDALVEVSPYLVRARTVVGGRPVDATFFADGRAEVLTSDERVAREVYERIVAPVLSGH